MKVATFREGARTRPGLVERSQIRAIECATLIEYIALPAHERAARHSAQTFQLQDVQLDAPVRPHKNIFCVGRNYLEHAKEGAHAFGRELSLPDVPTFFTKAPTSLAGPDETIAFEAGVSQEYDWEAELAVVIGAHIKDADETQAARAIFGYTCGNDLTARDLQQSHRQWFKGKSLDHACPLGPWIVDAGEIGDRPALEIALRVNGVQKQHSNTSSMIFSVPRVIAELSKGMTLEPGDVILTGTPEGVGFARQPPEFLRDGDVVEVEIERIGILRNRVQIS